MRIKFFFMDKRLKDINLLLSEYSFGRFDKRLAVSSKLDEIDAVINGINMMGEELKSITISRDYFTNIFNSVTDMVFILNSRGIIEDVNHSAEVQLGYKAGCLQGKAFNELHHDKPSFFHHIKKQLRNQAAVVVNDGFLYQQQGGFLNVRINASRFNDAHKKKLILLTASDTSFQVQAEKMIIRAIIDTQEKERQRLAKDLHDSLTQQLSAIKFYISSITETERKKKEKEILVKSNEALTEVIADMRNVCFNLMPRTLEEFGLVKAVKEFCDHNLRQRHTRFVIRQQQRLPAFSAALSIDLYRVIQEVISNAIRHGQAREINICFSYQRRLLTVSVSDNGKGFDTERPARGMGLQNVQSRVKSHNGRVLLTSKSGEGTECKITIPVNP